MKYSTPDQLLLLDFDGIEAKCTLEETHCDKIKKEGKSNYKVCVDESVSILFFLGGLGNICIQIYSFSSSLPWLYGDINKSSTKHNWCLLGLYVL